MHYIEKANLVNKDSVISAISFNQLVNIILKILQNTNFSLFGKFRVKHSFIRIELQQRGSPHAHILLFLENDFIKPTKEWMQNAIELINALITVDRRETSGNIVMHKHNFSCYKRSFDNCHFDAPIYQSQNCNIDTNEKRTKFFRSFKSL